MPFVEKRDAINSWIDNIGVRGIGLIYERAIFQSKALVRPGSSELAWEITRPNLDFTKETDLEEMEP